MGIVFTKWNYSYHFLFKLYYSVALITPEKETVIYVRYDEIIIYGSFYL